MCTVLILVIYSVMAESRQIEFVSQDQVIALQKKFEHSQSLDTTKMKGITGRDLKCTMYGLKTRLQVERNVLLYKFQTAGAHYQNQGAHVVENYRFDGRDLVGFQESLVEIVRWDESQKLLISRLSKVTGEDRSKSRNDLAIIECAI